MKIDAIIPAIQLINLEANKINSKVNVGDILNVQIISNLNNEVVLRLSDGKTITASSLNPLEAAVGEFINLVVNEKKDGKLFLETMHDSGEVSSNQLTKEQVKNLLDGMKLSITPKNVEIINQMVEREVTVNKQNVMSVLNNMARFPNLDVTKAVFMIANGVDFEEKNINLLNQYSESKIALGNQIESILSQLTLMI